MTSQDWPRELDVALDVVKAAAVLARDIQEEIGSEALLKADRSPVTIADFAVQALIAHRLTIAFPDDSVVAEEDSSHLRSTDGVPMVARILNFVRAVDPQFDRDRILSSIDRGAGTPGDRFWALDPIDGTEGFVRAGQYVVALALVEHGEPLLGILGCPRWSPPATRELLPETGSVLFAVKGRGAFSVPLTTSADPQPLRVSSVRDPHKARLLRSFESRHIDLPTFKKIIEALDTKLPPTLMDSQAKHAAIAAGQADLMLRIPARPDFRDKMWDHAAGTLILEGAGGRVTDLRGAPLDFSAGRLLSHNYGVVASNGQLHAAALEAIRQVGNL